MEAFESFVALTMEADTEDGRLVVSEAIKFPVVRQTAKTSHVEFQTHGFEVDRSVHDGTNWSSPP